MMGWWKPYFFVDPTGVQLLFDWAKIDDTLTFISASGTIALLCLMDRLTVHWGANHKRRQGSVYMSTLAWTVQRCTGGFLMLIMMSFNLILFLEVVVFSGLAELGMRFYYYDDDNNHSGDGFQPLKYDETTQIEMMECC